MKWNEQPDTCRADSRANLINYSCGKQWPRSRFAAMRSPENQDIADGIVFAWSITFITESHLLCLTAQADAHRTASELGELGLKFPMQTLLQQPTSDSV